MTNKEKDFQDIKNILSSKVKKKAPAYQWQELALRIINELKIPNFKRSSVFKICKENSIQNVENAFNDTKELAQGRDRWKYFFKVVADKKEARDENS